MAMLQYNKESGYFLIIVLVFIHLFSIITVYELMQLKDHIQYAKKMWQIATDSVLSEYVLRVAEKKLAYNRPVCLIKTLPSDELKHMSDDWWRVAGCHIAMQGKQYFYVIETVRHDPCAVLSTNTMKQGVTYYRISLLQHHSSILQIITAVSDVSETCAGNVSIRQLGRQSWRQL